MGRPRVLFVCTHNSARSQMAEGLLRAWGEGQFEASSAGTLPTEVRPEAIAVMAELGIDISAQRSTALVTVGDQPWDLVVTVCDLAREACPVVPRATMIHWSIADPAAVEGDAARRLAAFRTARDALAVRIRAEILHPA